MKNQKELLDDAELKTCKVCNKGSSVIYTCSDCGGLACHNCYSTILEVCDFCIEFETKK